MYHSYGLTESDIRFIEEMEATPLPDTSGMTAEELLRRADCPWASVRMVEEPPADPRDRYDHIDDVELTMGDIIQIKGMPVPFLYVGWKPSSLVLEAHQLHVGASKGDCSTRLIAVRTPRWVRKVTQPMPSSQPQPGP